MSKNITETKIIFMGSSDFAGTILYALSQAKYDIAVFFTRPDKKAGRGLDLQKTAVKIICENDKIPVFQPETFDEEIISQIRIQKPDLITVAAYGKILPQSILEIPERGAINVHASILPKFRGPSPIQNALLMGEKETGTTIMLMDKGIDTGSILSQKKIDIASDETYPQVSKKLADLSAELLLKTIPLWMEKKIQPEAQDNSKAILCQLIEKRDGKIIWSDEAESIYNRWRAFVLWPGIFTFWQRDKQLLRIKLNKISFSRNNPKTSRHIGEVFQLGEKIAVETSRGAIFLEEIQMEGKNNLSAGEFIRGYPDFAGSILK